MSDPAYVVQLASGQFLDSNGHFQAWPPAGPYPQYQAPGGLLLVDIGMDPAALRALGAIASLAKTLSVATGVVGVVVNVASALFSLTQDKDAALKSYIKSLFDDQARPRRGFESA